MSNTAPPRKPVALGVFIGAGAVQEVSALAGATIGLHWTDKVDVVGEGLFSQNAVTRRRLDVAKLLASHLQETQGSPAAGTVDAPTFYAGGGVRLFLGDQRSWRPYILVTAGVARVTLRPTITLSGGDVTAKLPQFGVTLGSDLTGALTKPAFSGGFGVRSVRGRKFIDLGLRYINIQTDGQKTGLIGAGGSFGFSL